MSKGVVGGRELIGAAIGEGGGHSRGANERGFGGVSSHKE